MPVRFLWLSPAAALALTLSVPVVPAQAAGGYLTYREPVTGPEVLIDPQPGQCHLLVLFENGPRAERVANHTSEPVVLFDRAGCSGTPAVVLPPLSGLSGLSGPVGSGRSVMVVEGSHT